MINQRMVYLSASSCVHTSSQTPFISEDRVILTKYTTNRDTPEKYLCYDNRHRDMAEGWKIELHVSVSADVPPPNPKLGLLRMPWVDVVV